MGEAEKRKSGSGKGESGSQEGRNLNEAGKGRSGGLIKGESGVWAAEKRSRVGARARLRGAQRARRDWAAAETRGRSEEEIGLRRGWRSPVSAMPARATASWRTRMGLISFRRSSSGRNCSRMVSAVA